MIIKSLDIEKFRLLKNINLPLGKQITVIAGQNGTMKSTILGMIAQPFTCSIENNPTPKFLQFNTESKFSEIFNLSLKHDKPKEHIYYINLYNENLHSEKNHIQVKSFERKKNIDEKDSDPNKPSDFIRFVTGKKRGKGYGNIKNIPVVYLSLKRLFPAGEVEKEKYIRYDSEFSEEENKEIIDLHNKIFSLNYLDNTNEKINILSDNKIKTQVGYENNTYDHFSNSSGEDNLTKIISACIYLKRVKKVLEEKKEYNGSILLIDEFDATLFPSSQIRLFKYLMKTSYLENIQIIITTHSLDLLNYIYNQQQTDKNYKENVKTLLLTNLERKITITQNPEINEIQRNLLINLYTNDKTKKQHSPINVFVEDRMAKEFMKSILYRRKGLHINYLDTMSSSEIRKISNLNIKELKNCIYILDGDQKNNNNKNNKIIYLPGEYAPECILADFLYNKTPDDPIWRKINLTKQECFEDYPINKNDDLKNNSKVKQAKKWIDKLSKEKNINIKKLFNLYLSDNQEEYQRFINEFYKRYNEIAINKGLEQLKTPQLKVYKTNITNAIEEVAATKK